MTNGSSQGLFVVVAVVIFGIFVAISYSLFRDILTPSLASMFEDSISLTSNIGHNKYNIKYFKDVSDIKLSPDKIITIIGNKAEVIEESESNGLSLFLSAENKTDYYGIGIEKQGGMKEDTFYRVSFQVEMIEGDASNIGGHNNGFFDMDSVYINGDKHATDWYTPAHTDFKEGNTYNIEFIMKTLPKFILTDSHSPNYKFFIQLNRGIKGTTFKYNLNNIKIIEVLPKNLVGG